MMGSCLVSILLLEKSYFQQEEEPQTTDLLNCLF